MNINFKRSIYKAAGSLLFDNMDNGIKRKTNSTGLCTGPEICRDVIIKIFVHRSNSRKSMKIFSSKGKINLSLGKDQKSESQLRFVPFW